VKRKEDCGWVDGGVWGVCVCGGGLSLFQPTSTYLPAVKAKLGCIKEAPQMTVEGLGPSLLSSHNAKATI
jgi:hypothetical protein